MNAQDLNELRKLILQGMAPEDLASITPDGKNMLAQMMQPQEMPQPRYDIAPMAMNSMRTESGPDAGRVVNLDFSQQRAQAQAPQRIKVAGYGNGIMSDLGETDAVVPLMDFARGQVDTPRGRGQYGKDGAIYVKGPDGSVTKILQGYDRDASYLAAKRDFELKRGASDLRKDEASIAQTQAATEHTQETTDALRAQRSIREDPNSQAVLEKQFGKAPPGMRWKADGTPEQMPGSQKIEDAKDVLQILDMAEPLLDKSTGSYIGSGVDLAARAVGHTTEGAKAAAELKALEGALISKMPKMSGPQSDKDVLLYKQMAGQIGDPTIPAAQKRAAMGSIRELNQRYAGMQGATAPNGSFNSMPNPAQYTGKRIQAPDGTIYKSNGSSWVRQ